ncbi:MAG: hypothetical protein JNK09_18450 [Prolixibacteraceae bacterium]|nr:hypothetical protein [Prolixibacteraceae bacterium]
MPIKTNFILTMELTKESILAAIKRIDSNPELRKRRESYLYDLEYNGRRYPPILVISEAHKILGLPEVTIRDFNNSTTKAFKLLTEHGFVLVQKIFDMPKVWFVFQGSTFNQDRGKKFLWAPKVNKRGGSQFYWNNLTKVKKGDIIFNYSKGIRAISVAENDSYQAPNPDTNSQWEQEGYKVDIKCFEFKRPVSIEDLIKRKDEINNSLEGISKRPFNVNGGANQGYLYEFSKEAGIIIRDIYGEPFGVDFLDEFFGELNPTFLANERSKDFMYERFNHAMIDSNVLISKRVIIRYISSHLTKPFVILTGLSGSGKTKLAQVFTKWICADESQYRLIPVGADWTNREPLLGYPNALEPGKYVLPETGALELILEAGKPENQYKPYFLILDEMNLSHVERYFADFLSAMESGEYIPLHSNPHVEEGDIPSKVKLPKNLFIVGTVNIDETTYMFSPKVLDRASVIEFRVTPGEMQAYLEAPKRIDLESISGLGADMAASFVEMAGDKDVKPTDAGSLNKVLVGFFNELKKVGAEFGYRSASEIYRFVAIANKLDREWAMDEILDCAIMQKLLPKVHGSRRKLEPVLKTLGTLCLADGKVIEDIFNRKEEIDFNDPQISRFPISLEKIDRMYRGLLDNGFTSYAEA